METEVSVPADAQRHEVVSVSLPRDLIRRANALIPKTRRSRVIAAVLTRFLDSVEHRRVAEEYAAYYARRSPRETREEPLELDAWKLSDEEAWTVLDRESRRGRRAAR